MSTHDGFFSLITNATIEVVEVLKAYKHQPYLKKNVHDQVYSQIYAGFPEKAKANRSHDFPLFNSTNYCQFDRT